MTLVVGATGLLGREVVRQLRARGHAVTAMVRRASAQRDALAALGAQFITGDLKDRASLLAACRGHETVVSTASATLSRMRGDSLATVDRDGQLVLIQAAQQARARRLVYVSVSPNLLPSGPLIRYKRQVESAVRASGLEWVILQPTAFMDVWLSPVLGWDLAGGRVRLFGKGITRSSLISVHDVAAFAVQSVERPALRNCDLPLGGPEPVAPNDVVRIAEQATGRQLRVQRIPAWVPRLLSTVLAPVAPLPASLMDLGAQLAEHDDVIDMRTRAVSDLGVRLTSVADYFANSCRTAGSPESSDGKPSGVI